MFRRTHRADRRRPAGSGRCAVRLPAGRLPRTLHQVGALDDYLAERGHQLDAVLSLTVDTEALIQRLLKRAQIEGRADDSEETIRHRMDVYQQDTSPLIDDYRDRGLLIEVDGDGQIAEVSERIFAALSGVADAR